MTGTASHLARLQRKLASVTSRNTEAQPDWSKYWDDPVGFARDVLRVEFLTAQQIEMMQAVVDHPDVVVVAANGTGKSFSIAVTVLHWTYVRRGTVILTSSTGRQVKEILLRREIGRAFRRAELPGVLTADRLRTPDDEGTVIAFTAGDASATQGVHHPRLLAVIDEAQGVGREIFEGVFASVTGAENRLLVCGNPILVDGMFADIARDPSWHLVTIDGRQHPNVLAGSEIVPGAITKRFIDRIASTYGTESDEYRSRVCGQFPLRASADSLIDRAWLEQAAALHRQMGRPSTGRLVFGCDPARKGAAATATCVRRGDYVIGFHEWRRRDLMVTVGSLQALFEEYGCGSPTSVGKFGPGVMRSPTQFDLVLDEPGIGGGAIDRLRELGYQVQEFNGSSPPQDSKHFANLRAESFFALREGLMRGKLALAKHERLWEELLAIRFERDSKGHLKLEKKKLTSQRLRRSPDFADALALTFAVSRKCTGLVSMADF